MKPRTAPAEQRRAALLDAAEAIVLSKGVAGLTVDDVTARAEVAKGTFYLYFRSKEQVLRALQDRFIDDLTSRQEAAFRRLAADDWLDRLQRWVEHSIRAYLARADLHDALFLHQGTDEADHGHLADPERNQHAAALGEILRSGAEAGTFDIDDPATATILLYNAMHGTADYLVELSRRGDTRKAKINRVITETLELCRRYLIPST